MTTRKTVTVHPAGPSFAGLLAILFIGLKLGGVIAWSWWWVLAPLWAPVALLLIVGALIVIVAVTLDARDARRRKRRIAAILKRKQASK